MAREEVPGDRHDSLRLGSSGRKEPSRSRTLIASERSLEGLARARQPRPHCPQGDSQPVGDRFIIHLLDLSEDEDRAMAVRQHREGFIDPRADLLGFQCPGRVASRVGLWAMKTSEQLMPTAAVTRSVQMQAAIDHGAVTARLRGSRVAGPLSRDSISPPAPHPPPDRRCEESAGPGDGAGRAMGPPRH